MTIKGGNYKKHAMDRREFFRRSFAAGTLAVVAPSVLISKETEKLPKREVKVSKLKPLEDISILRRYDPSIGWFDIGYVNAIEIKAPPPIEITSIDSKHGYREFIPNPIKSFEISVDAAFSKKTYDTIESDFKCDKAQIYEILLPNDTSFEFEGFITEIPLTFPNDDKVGCEISFHISGYLTYNTLYKNGY